MPNTDPRRVAALAEELRPLLRTLVKKGVPAERISGALMFLHSELLAASAGGDPALAGKLVDNLIVALHELVVIDCNHINSLKGPVQ